MMTGKLQNGLDGASSDDAAPTILAVLAERRIVSSICPADAARRIVADKDEADPDDWRHHLGAVRRAVPHLVRSAKIDILCKVRAVEPTGVRGVIRLRLRRPVARDSENA